MDLMIVDSRHLRGVSCTLRMCAAGFCSPRVCGENFGRDYGLDCGGGVREIRWWVGVRSHARDTPYLGYEREVSVLVGGVSRPARPRRFGH